MTPTEYRTHLAGGKFRPAEAQSITLALEPEDTLELEREPTNPYDENAVKVLRGGTLLGYVPKDVAAQLAPWLDGGWEFSCACVGKMQPLMPFLRITPEEK